MYFNTTSNETEEYLSHSTCLICFNEFDNCLRKAVKKSSKIYALCCKYLHSAITNNINKGNDPHSHFCNRCFESATQLGDLTEKLEVFQKAVSEHIFTFSLEILQRRANIQESSENVVICGKNLTLSKVSSLQCPTSAVIHGNAPPVQHFQISVEEEPPIVENISLEQEQNVIVDPLIIPDESDNIVIVNIKTDNTENAGTVDNYYDEACGMGDSENPTLENISCSPTTVSSHQNTQIHSGGELTRSGEAKKKHNLLPFVKLERIKLTCKTSCSKQEIDQSVNSFNIEYDDPLLINQSESEIFQITSSTTPSNNCSSRQKSEEAFDPDFQIRKMPCRTRKPRMKLRKRSSKSYPQKSTGTERPSCYFCEKLFSCTDTLKLHLQTIHNNDLQFKCSICFETFVSKESLSRHFRNHTAERRHKCEFCPERFVRKMCLERHLKKHSKSMNINELQSITSIPEGDIQSTIERRRKESYKCIICKKSFACQVFLVSHYSCHHGRKKIVRPKISTLSKAVDPLKISVAVGITNPDIQVQPKGKKQFPCSVCGKLFSSRIHLEGHFRIHTGEKPFKCNKCDYACTTPYSLRRHEIYRHSTLLKFKCRECGKPAKTFQLVKSHFKHIHFAIEFTKECVIYVPGRAQ